MLGETTIRKAKLCKWRMELFFKIAVSIFIHLIQREFFSKLSLLLFSHFFSSFKNVILFFGKMPC